MDVIRRVGNINRLVSVLSRPVLANFAQPSYAVAVPPLGFFSVPKLFKKSSKKR
jgi:hypothetical protein